MPHGIHSVSDLRSADIFDLRDLPAIWADAIDPDDPDPDRRELADAIRGLCADLTGMTRRDDALRVSDLAQRLADHGNSEEPTMIADDHFEDYARSFAEDIGAVESDARWPACHIDWPAAADSLRGDFQSVSFLGRDWWIR